MTVDCCAFNRQTQKDVYQLPQIDDLLDKLSKAHYASAIKLSSEYHQIKLADNSCDKTTFKDADYLSMPYFRWAYVAPQAPFNV